MRDCKRTTSDLSHSLSVYSGLHTFVYPLENSKRVGVLNFLSRAVLLRQAASVKYGFRLLGELFAGAPQHRPVVVA